VNQNTLAQSFSLQGVGIHTGTVGKITVHPASENFGRVFRTGNTEFAAHADFVVDTSRCTTLGKDGAKISTVEHLLSALAGLNVDNALIEVEGAEIPILDGSALPFAEAILAAGIEAQSVPAKMLIMKDSVELSEGNSRFFAETSETDKSEFTVTTTFDNWTEGASTQKVSLSPEVYLKEIAPARTFAFRQEVEMLIAAGLAKGGSLDNALIVTPPDEFSSPLRLPEEWCRHKLLDLIGDLSLLNVRPMRMSFLAVRPGHRLNVAFAQKILQEKV